MEVGILVRPGNLKRCLIPFHPENSHREVVLLILERLSEVALRPPLLHQIRSAIGQHLMDENQILRIAGVRSRLPVRFDGRNSGRRDRRQKSSPSESPRRRVVQAEPE